MTTSSQAGCEPTHTPLLEGPHLRVHTGQGPLPPNEALHLSYGHRSFPLHFCLPPENGNRDLLIDLPHALLHTGQFYPGRTLSVLSGGNEAARMTVQSILHPLLQRWPGQVSRQTNTFRPEVLECCCLNLELDLITAPFIRDYTVFRSRGTGSITIRVQTVQHFISAQEACRLAQFIIASGYPSTYLRTEYRQLTETLLDGLVIHFSLQQEDASLRGKIVVN